MRARSCEFFKILADFIIPGLVRRIEPGQTQMLGGKMCISSYQEASNFMDCYTQNKSRVMCCESSGVTDPYCLKICDGSAREDMLQKKGDDNYFKRCSKDFRKINKCMREGFLTTTPAPTTTPSTAATPKPTLRCPRTTTFSVNGVEIINCITFPPRTP